MTGSGEKTATISSRFISVVRTPDKEYVIQTVSDQTENPFILTKVLNEGKTVSQKRTDYREMLNISHIGIKLLEVMLRQHQAAISVLTLGKLPQAKTPSDYIEELKVLLRKKSNKSALVLLSDALSIYPDDPFLLSYQGCLEAIVNKNYVYGIQTCRNALALLDDKIPFGEDFFYPFFYLNLGRAYLAAGDKREAIESLRQGLKYDSGNREILWEMKKLGVRKRPAISLLKRSNPINKYVGMLLHKLRK
jgi:tetratricopeptide (TPR) repeat protein